MKRCRGGKKKKSGQPETESYRHTRFHKPRRVHTPACTHQYAVTKASQIGNSFSQFRLNDHRGNVNVSDGAGASLYSLSASIFTLHDVTRREADRRLDDMLSNRMKSDERQKHCRVPPKKKKQKREKRKKEKKKNAAIFSSRPLSSEDQLRTRCQPPHICI